MFQVPIKIKLEKRKRDKNTYKVAFVIDISKVPKKDNG